MSKSLVPPLSMAACWVMSSLPLGLFAPWQPKQFSFSIGATSLMKLSGFAGALASACGGRKENRNARAAAMAAHRMHRQARERNMGGSKRCSFGGVVGGWVGAL